MSWQAYVDSSLVGTGNLEKAAIFSAAGDSVWATSPKFTVSAKEMQDIVKAYTSDDTRNDLFGTGIHIGGEKYVTIKADGRSLYGKQGKAGIVIVKTTQAILVGRHPESVGLPNAAKTVEDLADYMVGVGY